MNIHAKRFDKVVYLDENGYDSNREVANKFLIKGNEYTVARTCVGQSSSTVELIEFPNKHFNTVMFRDAIEVNNHKPISIPFPLPDPRFTPKNGYPNRVGMVEDEVKLAYGSTMFNELGERVVHVKHSSENKFPHNGQNLTAKEIFMDSSRNPMTQPVFTPPRSKNDWDLNMQIPQRTIDRHNAFDDHFTITGILTYTVLKQKGLMFNNFDWCQLHAINVSKRMKHGKWIETTTYHILAWRNEEKSVLLAELKNRRH